MVADHAVATVRAWAIKCVPSATVCNVPPGSTVLSAHGKPARRPFVVIA